MSHPIPPVLDLLGFLTLGLLGGFGHCVGMCSPFVLFVSRRYTPPGRGRAAAFAAQAWYTAGRIATYAALGALAGALGGVITTAAAFVGVRRGALVVAGVVLVVWGIVALLDLAWFGGPGSGPARLRSALRLLPAAFRLIARPQSPGHPFATGLFLGLLPCGFLYSAVVAAVGRGGPVEGATALALFGVGTAPALLAVSLADELIARSRASLNRLAQLFILAMGAWFLWRGLRM